jgi:hypothetical protein
VCWVRAVAGLGGWRGESSSEDGGGDEELHGDGLEGVVELVDFEVVGRKMLVRRVELDVAV